MRRSYVTRIDPLGPISRPAATLPPEKPRERTQCRHNGSLSERAKCEKQTQPCQNGGWWDARTGRNATNEGSPALLMKGGPPPVRIARESPRKRGSLCQLMAPD